MEQQKPVQAVNSNDSATHRNEKKFPRRGDPVTKDFSGSQGEQLASELVKAKMKIHEESIARQRAEQALRESEHRFQTFIEAIPQQVWTAEPDGTLDYVNDRVLKYFNRAFDEMIGWGWKGVIHQDDLPMCLKRWADARRTGEPYEMEFRLQRGSDGAYLWHVGRALPVHDEKGRIIQWFGTNTEITAFKVIEENLARLNQQKKLILESVGEGIYGLDIKGRTTFVNPAAAKMIGWNLQDLLGKSLHAVLHHTRPDGTPYPPEECPIYAALKDGEVHQVDHEVFWRKDGTSFPVEYTSTPIWEEGTLKGAVVTFLDITERKQAEEQLRKSEASLAHAQRIAHLGSWEWNMADNSEVWSDEQYRIFGYRPEEIGPSYQRFLDAVHPHDRERVLAAVRATVHDDAPYDIEFRIVRQDKSERVIHAQGQVLRDSQDKPVRMIGTVLDITERRRSKALLEGEKVTLEMITKGADLTRILHRICQMVEDHSDGMLCSILILEGKRLRHGAAPSLPDSYNQKIDGMTIGANTGSCGTAAFRKEPVFVSDIAKDPLWERYKDLALPHGLMACWSTPFYSSKGSVLGTFALYYTQPRSSDRESQDLVKIWANLAGIAVERQQSEDLLRASEEKFRAVTQSANDAIISTDGQGLVTSWNPAAQVMFAYEEREILGRPLEGLMSERYVDAHRMGLERFKKPGAKRQLQRIVELHGRRKNGSEFPLELSLSSWEMNGALFFTGIIRDITERKRAEEQLRKSEASLTHAQRIAHIGSWDWNMADDSEVWSDEQYRIFGYQPEEIGPSYQRFLDAVHPHDRERVLAAVRATVHDDAPYDIEFRIVRQDKSERVIHAQGQVLRDSQDKPVRMIGTVLDITERRRSKALLEGEKVTLEMITKGADLTRILHRICQMVEDHSDGMLCSILILEGKRLRHGAAPSLPDSYNQKIDGMTIGANTGSCGTAAFRKEPVFVSDIAKDPLWERYKDLALPHGLMACWSTPFYSSKGSVLGTFALYYTQPRSSDRESQDLVKIWANLAGIAVERQQSEDLLRASEEKFRAVTQSANDAIISTDGQGLVTSWNPAAQVMFAYEEREILGRPLEGLMSERYVDAHRMGLERFKKPGAKRQLQRIVELHGRRKNGSEFPLELSLSSWEMNGALFFTGIIRDITERKQAEEAIQKAHDQLESRVQQRTAELEHTNRQLLQEIADRQQAQEQLRKSEDHLQALLTALPELIILYRKDGTFLEIRLGSGVTTQLVPEECQGKRIDQVLPVELAEYIIANIQRALETKKIQVSEYEVLRNGKTENYEVRFIAKGESEVVSVVQNISERKRMQEQIHEYTNNLERVIKKRTAEIKQLEIQQMRNEKLAALGQLAAGVAHEINNPLAGVSNGFAMIKDFVPQDSTGFQYVRIVERGIDRMTKIIEHMYQLYGPRAKDLKPVNVGTVVKDVLQLLEKQLNQRDLQVVTEAPPDLSGIYLSGTLLDQVLTNLIQNAIEASPRGSEVKIQAKTEGDSLRLSVTDSGSGISPELCPRIFEPFFTTKAGQQKPSMGLGLSVSNSIVEAMGGRIDVDTKFGEGSTFTVVIPMNTSVSKHRGQAGL